MRIVLGDPLGNIEMTTHVLASKLGLWEGPEPRYLLTIFSLDRGYIQKPNALKS